MSNYTPPDLSTTNDVVFDFEAVRKAIEALLRALPQRSADSGYLFSRRPNEYANLGFEYRRKARIADVAKFEVESRYEAIRGALIRARDAVGEATGAAGESIDAALRAEPSGALTLAEIEAQLVRFSAAISRAQAFADSTAHEAATIAGASDEDIDDLLEEEPIPVRVSNLAASDYYAISGRPPDLGRAAGGFMFFHEDVFWALGITMNLDGLARKSIERWKTKHWGYRQG